ncbi:uncharacterized protein LOC144161468 [Haemaphysalis longicornis]
MFISAQEKRQKRPEARPQARELKIPAVRRQTHVSTISDCSLERCQQLCEEHYGATMLDVTSRCVGDGCNCEYREPCRPMACYHECLRKQRGNLNLRANCVRHECRCKYDNYCEPASCDKKCQEHHRFSNRPVKGLCVGPDCTCTQNHH